MTACESCGDPIRGRAPNAVFCAACRCERDRAQGALRQRWRWARMRADPVRRAVRNATRAVRDYDRRIDDGRYAQRTRTRTRRWHAARRRGAARDRGCTACGAPVRPPRVNGRLSSTRLCYACRIVHWHGPVPRPAPA